MLDVFVRIPLLACVGAPTLSLSFLWSEQAKKKGFDAVLVVVFSLSEKKTYFVLYLLCATESGGGPVNGDRNENKKLTF